MKLARLTAFLSFASLVFSAETVTDTNGEGEYAVQMPQVYDGYEKNLQNCKAMGSGWDLPTIWELFSTPHTIVSKGEKSLYASSTSIPANGDEIYYFSFENKDVNTVKKTENLYSVCIKKSDKKPTPPHERVKWLQPERERQEYQAAVKVCENKGGRLPSIEELFSLALAKVQDEDGFRSKYGFMQPKYYWSKDGNDDFSNTALVSGFLKASVANNPKNNKSFVRCVTDGR